MNILMLSAENDAIPGGKVGGIGDVVRDIPPALAQRGHRISVICPGYQKFSKLVGASHQKDFSVNFAGKKEQLSLHRYAPKGNNPKVALWLIEHPLFAAGGVGKIYCNDGNDRPFATDASKFALFCVAVASALQQGYLGKIDLVHQHDWHAAMFSVLREFDSNFASLKKIPTVYSIHNLALQGVRPFAGDYSSLESWFPKLKYKAEKIRDPRATNCINPMRAGINLSDRVHAVSPTYAKEILQESNHELGVFGGEGLHKDLHRAHKEKRLQGILNGCEYPNSSSSSKPVSKTATKVPPIQPLLQLCEQAIIGFMGNSELAHSAHLIGLKRLEQAAELFKRTPPKILVTSVGRLTDQKMLLLRQEMADGRSALEHCLDKLGSRGLMIILGSGDSSLELFLTGVSSRNSNLIFLQGYSQATSDALYEKGDLFLMPSSFEPCGISQMLAMRVGQPCLVHQVGGLKDTVIDLETGFSFKGKDLASQAKNMVSSFTKSLKLHKTQPEDWQRISNNALNTRFLWSDAAQKYEESLYDLVGLD